MSNEFSGIRSNVKNLEINLDEHTPIPEIDLDSSNSAKKSFAAEIDNRQEAISTIANLKLLAKKKIAQGFVLKHVLIKNGYKEFWALP